MRNTLKLEGIREKQIKYVQSSEPTDVACPIRNKSQILESLLPANDDRDG